MTEHYYIGLDEGKEGPHDLVSIMRRIRVGKIAGDTPIFIGDADEAVTARSIAELGSFFEQPASPGKAAAFTRASLGELVRASWRFTIGHDIITVFAGFLLLLGIAIVYGLVIWGGPVLGAIMAFGILLFLHHLYLACILRHYRGQTLGDDFVNRRLLPKLPRFIVSCLVLALMMAGGLVFLLMPGMLHEMPELLIAIGTLVALGVAIAYSFVPFLLIDKRYSMVEAMQASRVLLLKHNRAYLGCVGWLTLFHLLCMALIIPIPLTLPMYAAALSDVYEKITTS